jgi:hypothetical protein
MTRIKTHNYPHAGWIVSLDGDTRVNDLLPGAWVRHKLFKKSAGVLVANSFRAFTVLWSDDALISLDFNLSLVCEDIFIPVRGRK